MFKHYVKEIDSTNSELKRLAERGLLTPGYALLAEKQSKGRGRGERVWQSASCKSMTASFWLDLHDLHLKKELISPLPLVISLAVIKALKGVDPKAEVGVKWPNDIYAKGRKMGGILCEFVSNQYCEGVVVGIGLNLTFQFSADSISWSEVSLAPLTAETSFERIGGEVYNLSNELAKDGFQSLITEWCKYCVHMDRRVVIVRNLYPTENFSLRLDGFDDKTSSKCGKTKGLGSQGELLLELENGDIDLVTVGDLIISK